MGVMYISDMTMSGCIVSSFLSASDALERGITLYLSVNSSDMNHNISASSTMIKIVSLDSWYSYSLGDRIKSVFLDVISTSLFMVEVLLCGVIAICGSSTRKVVRTFGVLST